jgi:steroid delta-isomerase-like uncharacterized protein
MDMTKNIDEYKLAWNSHDVNKIIAFFTDDGIFDDVAQGTVYRGKKEVTAYLNTLFADMPDLKLDFKSVFGAGDWMGIEVVMSGTFAHSSMPGIKATGKTFSVRGVSALQLRNGQITRKSYYMNMVAFLQQVGLMPGPPK